MTRITGGGGGGQQIYNTFTTPVDGNFSWVNQGSATTTVNLNGGITLNTPAQTENARMRVITAVATPYTVTAAVFGSNIGTNFQFNGIMLRESATGKISSLHLGSQAAAPSQQLQVIHWTSPTGRGGATFSTGMGVNSVIWLQITNDGTNLIYRFSIDGYNFIQVLSELKTVPFTTAPDQYGYFVDDETGTVAASLTLLSWKQT